MKGDYNMKPTFAKLGLKMNNSVKTIIINDQEIEVKQYLPINDKLELISSVINWAADANNFANPVKIEIFTKLEIVFRYTNLTFTEKQREDPAKLYDLLEENQIFDKIFSVIPSHEYEYLIKNTAECVTAIYTYNSSIMGVLERLNNNYDETSFDINKLKEDLANIGDVTLLQDVMKNLG